MPRSVHEIELTDIKGNPLPLSSFVGKKILLVNTASACGLTPQYKQLQELHENFGHKLAVIGLPCNDFGAQEPGSEAEVQRFCEVNYQVTFPLTQKVSILGAEVHPLYQYLTRKAHNGHSDSEVKWNFQKYLINEAGHLEAVFGPMTDPLSEEILKALGV